MTSDIPPLRKLEDLPPIKTQDDLCQFWRMLMGKLGFGQRCLWVVFLDLDGYIVPGMIEVGECPPLPDRAELSSLMQAIVEAMHGDPVRHSAAFLWSRPGGAATEQGDLAWARLVGDLANKAMIATWPMHHANDHDLRVFAPDELAA